MANQMLITKVLYSNHVLQKRKHWKDGVVIFRPPHTFELLPVSDDDDAIYQRELSWRAGIFKKSEVLASAYHSKTSDVRCFALQEEMFSGYLVDQEENAWQDVNFSKDVSRSSEQRISIKENKPESNDKNQLMSLSVPAHTSEDSNQPQMLSTEPPRETEDLIAHTRGDILTDSAMMKFLQSTDKNIQRIIFDSHEMDINQGRTTFDTSEYIVF